MIKFRAEKKNKQGKKVPLDGSDLGPIVLFRVPITERDPETRESRITGSKPRVQTQIVTDEGEASPPRIVVADITEQQYEAIRAIVDPVLIPEATDMLGL